MSWKSIVSAGLLCVLASPALAAPTVTVAKGGTGSSGHLDANGNWVWKVQIAPSNPIPTGASPLAAELGFRETAAAELLSAANLSTGAGDDFDTDNPGEPIFTWEATTEIEPGRFKPIGVQVNLPTDEVFAALGSVNYTTTGPKDFIQIVVQGPSTAAGRSLTTTMQWLGSYAGMGRIAEVNPAGTPATINHDTYSGSVTRTAKPGDANLDGNVDGLDLAILADNFGQSGGKHWGTADYNTDNTNDGLDLAILADNFGFTGPPVGGAGAALSGSVVPEPATVVLLTLAALGGLGLTRRRQ